jgi:hypothetical protein
MILRTSYLEKVFKQLATPWCYYILSRPPPF